MPLDFMQKALETKQTKWDKQQELLDTLADTKFDAIGVEDKKRVRELEKEIQDFVDASVGRDLGSSEYARDFKNFQRKIKNDKDLKKITSAYNTFKEIEELRKEWQKKGDPTIMADVFGEADRRIAAYSKEGAGFRGNIGLQSSSEIMAGVNPIEESKKYFSQVSSDELESLTGVTTGGRSPEKMAMIAEDLYSDWRLSTAGRQYEMQYDNKKLPGTIPNENYLNNTEKVEVLDEYGNPIVDPKGEPVMETEYETYTREKDEWLQNQFYQIGQSYANSKIRRDDDVNTGRGVLPVTSATDKNDLITSGAETTQDLQTETTNVTNASNENTSLQQSINDYNKAVEVDGNGNYKYNDQNSKDIRKTNPKKIEEMKNRIKDNEVAIENYNSDIDAVAIAQINSDPNTTTRINENQINQAMTDVENNEKVDLDGNGVSDFSIKHIVNTASSSGNYIGPDGLYMNQREMLDVAMGESRPVTADLGIEKQIDSSPYNTDKHNALLAQLQENVKEKTGLTLGDLWGQRKDGTITSANRSILENEIDKLYNTESADYNIYNSENRLDQYGKYVDKNAYIIPPTPEQALQWGFHESLRYIPNSIIEPGKASGQLDYMYSTIPLDVQNKSKSGTYATWSINSKQGDVEVKYYEAIKEKLATSLDKQIANGTITENEKNRQLGIIDNLIARSKFVTAKDSEIINPAPIFSEYYIEDSAGQANLLSQNVYYLDEQGLENYNNSPEFTDEFTQAFNEHKGSKTSKFKLVHDNDKTVIDGTVVQTSDKYLESVGKSIPWESNGPITIKGVEYNTPKEAEAAGYYNIKLDELTAVSSEIASNGAPEAMWTITYDTQIKDVNDEEKIKVVPATYQGAKIQMNGASDYVNKVSNEYLAAYKDYAIHGKTAKADESMLEYLKVRDRSLFKKFNKVKNIGEGESQSVIVPLLEDQGMVRMDVKQLPNDTWSYIMTYVDSNGNRETSNTEHTYDSYGEMINSILPFRDIRSEMYSDAIVTFDELE
jgi:hypothetical protein